MAFKLHRYNHFNEQTQTITPGEAETPAYLYAEAAPADYTQIHTIVNLDLHGFGLDFDYKRVRDLIKVEAELITWALLTEEQKLICTKHKIGTIEQRAAALNNDYHLLVSYGETYHKNVLETRAARMTAAKSNIHNRLGHIMYGPYTAPEVILSEITEDVILMYENEGLGGLCDGDNAPGLMDYLNETTGSPYENGAGLRSKPWTPYGFATCDLLATHLLDILQKGIY